MDYIFSIKLLKEDSTDLTTEKQLYKGVKGLYVIRCIFPDFVMSILVEKRHLAAASTQTTRSWNHYGEIKEALESVYVCAHQ